MLLDHAGEHLLHVRVMISDLGHHVFEYLVLSADAFHLFQEDLLVVFNFSDINVYGLILCPLAVFTRPLCNEDS